MLQGKILWISDRDRNGIILINKIEYYFDASVTFRFDHLKRGDHVTFNLNENIKGCRCAKNVILIEAA